MLYASLAAPNSGNNTLIASVTGKEIWVYELEAIADSPVACKFYSGTTALTGTMNGVSQISLAMAPPGAPHFKTAITSAFVLNLGAAVSVNGWIAYDVAN